MRERGRKPVKKGARRRPPFGKVDHQVSHAVTRRYRKRFLALFGPELDFGAPLVYDRTIFERILGQPGCAGLRFYPGIGDDGKYTLLFCGVDKAGNDLLQGIIGDMPWRCPPYCAADNGVTMF